jgi:hypothetical protein
MAGRPNNAAPPALPAQVDGHADGAVGMDDLPLPDSSAPFPALSPGLPGAADPGVDMAGGHMPDLPDFDFL